MGWIYVVMIVVRIFKGEIFNGPDQKEVKRVGKGPRPTTKVDR